MIDMTRPAARSPFRASRPRRARLLARLCLAVVVGVAGAGAGLVGNSTLALAAGSSDAPVKKRCRKGRTWSKSKGKCVRDDSAALTPEDRYEAGRALAHAGAFEDAVATLRLADHDDPRVLNYLGFASRKAGRLDEGMAYYERALAIDPDFTLARSYMGQALLEMGDREGALEQLRLIRAVTGPVALEYVMLRDALSSEGGAY